MPKRPTPAPASSSHVPARPVRSSLYVRIARQSILLTALIITVLGAVSFLVARFLVTERIVAQVSDTASAREDLLESSLHSQRERTSLLSLRPDIATARGNAAIRLAVARMWNDVQRQNVSVLGMTVFSSNRVILSRMGEQSAVPVRLPTSTTLSPVTSAKAGWIANDVYVPVGVGINGRMMLAVRYDMHPVIAQIFGTGSLEGAVRMFIASRQGGEVFVIDRSDAQPLRGTSLGDLSDEYVHALPVARAVSGVEGAGLVRDDRGRPVFAAYRFLPSLGWGLSIEVAADSALAGVTRLGFTLAGISLMLLGLSAALGSMLARQVTLPLVSLAQKVTGLAPGHWGIKRSVHTNDEVEVLDSVVADLAGRLKGTYDHLEEQVTKRTDELRRQYLLDRTILESIEYGVIVTDAQGIVTNVNPAACGFLQRTSAEIVGMPSEKALPLQLRKKHHTGLHPLHQVLRDRRAFRAHPSMHYSIIRPDETLMPITLMAVPLLQGKKINGVIAVIQDITLERQIDYMKSEFISLASHQLRTPLSSIRWYTELLATESKKHLSDDERTYLAEIAIASKRMANLLEALLHVARLEGGGLSTNLQSIDLCESLHGMMDEWQEMALEKQCTLHFSLPKRSVQIATDPVLLQIILQNFLTNAMKYSPQKKTIDVTLTVQAASVTISVEDHGIGIPAAEQKRLFQKFFRASNVRKMDTDGNGLGLYISQSIAQTIRAKITFVSTEGKGSTFTVTLPRKGK